MLVPHGVAIGAGVPVVVKTPAGESQAAPVNTADLAPELLAPSSFAVAGRQYAVATLPGSDGTTAFVGPSGAIAGVNMRRETRRGDHALWDRLRAGVARHTSRLHCDHSEQRDQSVTVQFGSTPATVQYAGLGAGLCRAVSIQRSGAECAGGGLAAGRFGERDGGAQNLYITTGQ